MHVNEFGGIKTKMTLDILLTKTDGHYVAGFDRRMKGTVSLGFSRVKAGGKKVQTLESGVEMGDENRKCIGTNPLVFLAYLCDLVGSNRIGDEDVVVRFSQNSEERLDSYERGAIKKFLDLYSEAKKFSVTYG